MFRNCVHAIGFVGRMQDMKDQTPEKTKARPKPGFLFFGAGDEIRTHDPNLGKVMLYP
jgi:hypothetical protein